MTFAPRKAASLANLFWRGQSAGKLYPQRRKYGPNTHWQFDEQVPMPMTNDQLPFLCQIDAEATRRIDKRASVNLVAREP
jgi:hypothetical protein